MKRLTIVVEYNEAVGNRDALSGILSDVLYAPDSSMFAVIADGESGTQTWPLATATWKVENV